MPSKHRQLLVVLGMVIPIVILAGLGAIIRRSQIAVLESQKWVSHTSEVQSDLSHLQACVVEAESAQRGYLLTSQDEYLKTFKNAKEGASDLSKELLALTTDNSPQQTRLQKLKTIIAAKIQELDETVSLAQGGRRTDAMKIVETGAGREMMEQIREMIGAAGLEEGTLLQEREGHLSKTTAIQTRASVTLCLFAGLTVLGILGLLWRMQKVHALVTMCAWSKTIELDGEWLSFEQYLETRFGLNISHGISPTEAVKFSEQLASKRIKV